MWTWQECYRSGLCPDVSSELLETTAEFYGVQPVIRAFPRKIRMDDYVSKAPSFSENVFSLDTAPKENNICHAFSVLTMPPAHTELIPAKNESMKEGLFDGGKRYAYIFFIFVFYKFCPNLLNGGIDEDRAPAKQSLLRRPYPLPSDRAIPVLWQNLESNV